ncbi:MAG: AraC family transcriptional regulator [Propionibacteriaceae bacterium]|nr:AraC family transcriptional regulator [Propionibacteriaceae bacterium]
MQADMETSDSKCQAAAADLSAVSGVPVALFDFLGRSLHLDADSHFCAATCPLRADGRCDPNVAHQFGCYEAERWGGQYIYYCPASLVFVATLTYEQGLSRHGLVAGPQVMGPVDDIFGDVDDELRGLSGALLTRTTAEVGALARVQRGICETLSSSAPEPSPAEQTLEPVGLVEAVHDYPFDVERRLVGMIRRGDRAGAAEMINHVLAALYLASDGDFPRLRQGATELITLFSRAAIDGGADARLIFGEKPTLDRRLERFTTVDELSGFLVGVFDRFVGYVFDFSKFQHANAIRQVVDYIRAHYAERITLADVSREVWFSPSYLSSVFSSEMGTGFAAYLQTVRVNKSKELLLGTHQTIAEISQATGFTDQSYFTKIFTRMVGVSPTQFRRQEVIEHG